MLARAIHRASDRADRPFVPFNCTAVPREMLESQLFGYRRGAFTGADDVVRGRHPQRRRRHAVPRRDRRHRTRTSSPSCSASSRQHEVHPLGEPQPVKVDVRIIAATNANLEQLVADGRFREDLFYRLNVLPLALPPLRERREEIPPLLAPLPAQVRRRAAQGPRHARATKRSSTCCSTRGPATSASSPTKCSRMVALAEPDATVTPALLSPEIQASRRTLPAADAPAEPEIRLRLDQPLPAAVDALEQILVRHALERSHGRVEEAARILGISRKGLFLKRRRWGLQQAS